MTDPEHDEAFEIYLKRRSVFPEALDEEPEPPAALDQRVLDQARKAIRAQAAPDHGKQQMARAPRWAMPVALAATILLCLSVVLNISLNTNRPAPNPQRMSAARVAAQKKVAGLTASAPAVAAAPAPIAPPEAAAAAPPAQAATAAPSAPPAQVATAAPSAPPALATTAAPSAPPALAAAAAPSAPPAQVATAAPSAPPAQIATAAPSAPPAMAAAAAPSVPARAIAPASGAAREPSSATYGEATAQAATGGVPLVASRSAADNSATLERRADADASTSATTPGASAGDRQTAEAENSGYVTRQAARAAAAGPHPTDPKVWLQQIDALRAAGKIDQANTEMHRFRAAFPGYVAKPAPPASSEPPK
jgi:hypothetical protein